MIAIVKFHLSNINHFGPSGRVTEVRSFYHKPSQPYGVKGYDLDPPLAAPARPTTPLTPRPWIRPWPLRHTGIHR